MKTTSHKITTPDGSYDAFCAYPTSPEPTPTTTGIVIVLQEIFGVNANIKSLCQWVADAGYIALAPDMFWRITPNVDLDANEPDEREKAFALMGQFDLDLGIADIDCAIRFARTLSGGNGKVATLGFCLGGRLAYVAACRTKAEAHISYYGVAIPDTLAEAPNISAPTILHIARLDQFVSKQEQAQTHAGLDAHPQVHIYDYDADHAFARIGGEHYDKAAANAAHARTLDLLKQTL